MLCFNSLSFKTYVYWHGNHRPLSMCRGDKAATHFILYRPSFFIRIKLFFDRAR